MKVIVFCVETDKKTATDPKYIDKALQYFYEADKYSFKPQWVYLNGKGNYNKRAVLKEIKEKIGPYKDTSEVVYCIDIDKQNANPEVQKINQDIIAFCESNNYKLVWFCKNIEEVFLGRSIPNTSKAREAKKFANLKNLGIASEKSLKAEKIGEKQSNLLVVMDKILVRKKNSKKRDG